MHSPLAIACRLRGSGEVRRRQIWEQFIKRAGPTEVKPEELELLVNNKLNGRQVS
jgi:hypothetical protein